MTAGVQLHLFAKPRRHDEERLIARLREAERPRPAIPGWGRVSRAEVKRLMTPLPRITAYD